MIELELPVQTLNLVLSAAAWVLLTVTLVLAYRVNGKGPVVLRMAVWGLWGYATLRLYSASSFIWGQGARDADVIDELRLMVLVVVALLLILSVFLVINYWHRYREE